MWSFLQVQWINLWLGHSLLLGTYRQPTGQWNIILPEERKKAQKENENANACWERAHRNHMTLPRVVKLKINETMVPIKMNMCILFFEKWARVGGRKTGKECWFSLLKNYLTHLKSKLRIVLHNLQTFVSIFRQVCINMKWLKKIYYILPITCHITLKILL